MKLVVNWLEEDCRWHKKIPKINAKRENFMTENNMYHVIVEPKNKKYEYDVFVSGTPHDEQMTDSKEMDDAKLSISKVEVCLVNFLLAAGFYGTLVIVVIMILGNIQDSILGYSTLQINNLANSLLLVSSITLTVLSFDSVEKFFDKKILNSYGRKGYYHFLGIIIFGGSAIIAAVVYTLFNWLLFLSEPVSLICILIGLHQYCYKK